MTKKIVQCKLFLDIFSEAIKKLNRTLNKHDHKIIDYILFKGSDYGKPAPANIVYRNIFNTLPEYMERPSDPVWFSKYFCSIHAIRTKENEDKHLTPGEKEEQELFYFINQYYLNIICPFMRDFLKKGYARKFYKKYIHEAIKANNNFKEDINTFSSMASISNIMDIAFRTFYSNSNPKAIKERKRIMIKFFKRVKRSLKFNKGYIAFDVPRNGAKSIQIKNLIDIMVITKLQLNCFGDISFTYRSNVAKALQRIWFEYSDEIKCLQKLAKMIFYTSFNICMTDAFIDAFDEKNYKILFGDFRPDDDFLLLKDKLIVHFTSNAAVYKVNATNANNALKDISNLKTSLDSCISIIKENNSDVEMSNHLIKHLVRTSNVVENKFTSLDTIVEYASIVKTNDETRRKLYNVLIGEIDLLKKSIESFFKMINENSEETPLDKVKENISEIYRCVNNIYEALFAESTRLDDLYELKTSRFNLPDVIRNILNNRIIQLNGCSFIIPSFYI